MKRVEDFGLTRADLADIVWSASARGFELSATDEHHLCQASSVKPDDWEYLPNLAQDAQDWMDDNA